MSILSVDYRIAGNPHTFPTDAQKRGQTDVKVEIIIWILSYFDYFLNIKEQKKGKISVLLFS